MSKQIIYVLLESNWCRECGGFTIKDIVSSKEKAEKLIEEYVKNAKYADESDYIIELWGVG
jgi:hypothetical protein